MEIKRLLVIAGISLIFIILFCEDIVEGSEDQTMEPETIEQETIGPETIGPETSENKMEVDEIIKLQMLQMELLKDVIKNKK